MSDNRGDGFQDSREVAYGDLHRGQHVRQQDIRRASAARILGLLFDHVSPVSVVDFGCGLGTWLQAARDLGVPDVHGVEGAWLEKTLLAIEPERVTIADLEAPIDLGRRFDLVVSIEVAEHLSPAAADPFINTLTRHADLILFSAAIPHQGGRHHVNERWPTYWNARFETRGYIALDFIRAQVWQDKTVLWWLRQNVLVYAKPEFVAANSKLNDLYHRVAGLMPLDVVHPIHYGLVKARGALPEHIQKLMKLLAGGGTFVVTPTQDGQLSVSKVSP